MSIREELNKLLKKNNRFMILTLAQKTFDVGPSGFSTISCFGHKDEVPALILAKEEGLFDYGACLRKDGDKYIAPTKDSVLEALEKAKAKKAVPEDMEAMGLDQKDFLKVFPYAKPVVVAKEEEEESAPTAGATAPRPPNAKTLQNEQAIKGVVRILKHSLTVMEYTQVMKDAAGIGRLTTARIKVILALGEKEGVWTFDDDLTITRSGEAGLAAEEADVPPGEPDEVDVGTTTDDAKVVEEDPLPIELEVADISTFLGGVEDSICAVKDQVTDMRHAMDNSQFYQRVQGSRTEMGVRMLDQKVMALADLIVSVGQIIDMGFGGDGYEAEAELIATIKEPLPAIQQATTTGRMSSAAPNESAKPRSDEAEEEGNEESTLSTDGDESSTGDSSKSEGGTDTQNNGVPDVYAVATIAGDADVFYKAVMKDYNIDTLRKMCHKVGIQSNSSFKSALANLLKQHVESRGDLFTK